MLHHTVKPATGEILNSFTQDNGQRIVHALVDDNETIHCRKPLCHRWLVAHRDLWIRSLVQMVVAFVALSAPAQQQEPPAGSADLALLATESENPASGPSIVYKSDNDRLGSINPENLPPLFSGTDFGNWSRQHRVRYYGWIDGGGQYVSTGSGELPAGFPAPNRFADGLIIDAGWIIVERPLAKETEGWDWGFRGDFYAGQDAALLRPMNSFGPQSPRFGTDFRQAFISLHMPVITKGGLDLQVGRQNVPIGIDTLMGPYRPMYTLTYYWMFHQVGSTGVFGTLHATKQLDILAGANLNYNTVFKLRGRAPSYLAKAIYTPGASRKTTIIGDVYTGPLPVPTLAHHVGSWQTLSEFEVRHNWSPRVEQVIQGNYEWDFNDPAEKGKTSAAQGAFSIVTVHLTRNTLTLTCAGSGCTMSAVSGHISREPLANRQSVST